MHPGGKQIEKLSQLLPKSLLQHQIQAKELDRFEEQLKRFRLQMDGHELRQESEENAKTYISEFLRNSFYPIDRYTINTLDRLDMVIQEGDAGARPLVLLECKRPQNPAEFPTVDKLNTKALQELLLYYLRQRLDEQNNDIKQLVITNGNEWFFFSANSFYECFYKNKALIREYEAFRDGKKDSSKTELFYKEIAQKYIAELLDGKTGKSLPFYYLDIRKEFSERGLLYVYKLFSPYYLLREPLGNDNNQLNKEFYYELLHIMGLEEQQEKGKKLIGRANQGKRHDASLLESTIYALSETDALYKVDRPGQYGPNKEEQCFHLGLELSLSWINRLLFLKLLEAQLMQQEEEQKGFLNYQFLPKFNKLKELFFSVLAKRKADRHQRVQADYAQIPYLNSSLFEETALEQKVLSISALEELELPLYEKTVLKDANLKRMQGKLPLLDYLFRFLEAYNFSESEGGEELLQEGEQQKSLISASVLGLIFEKINGYQDGSFYTPAYITMYMSRQSLQKAVIQKLAQAFDLGEDIEDLEELNFLLFRHYKKMKAEAERQAFRLAVNAEIDSLRICDPAVGSGHFLVSALNELLYIKNELGLLLDAENKPLRIELEIENDELIIRDQSGDLHEYQPKNKSSQQIQQAIFENKRHLIENCLFGVDLNPNSVKICRLRLWIELLKHAYYTQDGELQTLPNIDINIKTGNSLISRFALDEDLSAAFKQKGRKKKGAIQPKYSLNDYRNAVASYKSSNDKGKKREIMQIIQEVKAGFQESLSRNFIAQVAKVRGAYAKKKEELDNLKRFGQKISKAEKAKLKSLKNKLVKVEAERDALINNEIYDRAFEWRFEFPEVLNEDGSFRGFDVVIGNPPYIRHEAIKWMKPYLKEHFEVFKGTADLYTYFVEQAFNIMRSGGQFSYIIPNKWMRAGYGSALRAFCSRYQIDQFLDFGDLPVFDEATTYPLVMVMQKQAPKGPLFTAVNFEELPQPSLYAYVDKHRFEVNADLLLPTGWTLVADKVQYLLEKIKAAGPSLEEYVGGQVFRGVLTGFNEAFVIDAEQKAALIAADPKSAELIKPFLAGRDIKRYTSPEANKFLVLFASGWTKKTYTELTEKAAWEKVSKDYPAIAKYLKPFAEKARKRTDQGDYWWELRPCAYYPEFEKEKIMLPDIAKYTEALIDTKGSYCTNTAYIIPRLNKYHLGILNSKVILFFYSNISSSIRGGYFRFIRQYLGLLPIPHPTPTQEEQITHLVEQRLAASSKEEQQKIEEEIDQAVYALYGLSEEEIKMVEGGI